MKILVAVERYFPAIGGAERVAQRIAEHFMALKHDVAVVTTGQRASEEVFGVRVERFPVHGNLARGISGEADAALRFIRSFGADAILCYAAQTWTADLCSTLLGERDRPAMVLAPCGFSALANPRYRAYFEQMRDLLPRYDALIFHSSTYQDWKFAASAGVQRLVVIPNGGDAQSSSRAFEIPVPAGSKAVVTVGSHVRSKGHSAFARAIRELGAVLPVRGVIVAPGRSGLSVLRGCQMSCAVRSRFGLVTVVDGREPRVALDAIGGADLFLLPSSIECSPLVILEAMAARVPWVSYDVGNVREFAGGCVVTSFEELVSCGIAILQGNHPGLGREGRRAWERNHRWVDILPKYERVLTDAVARRTAEQRLFRDAG